jgi:hypothetical protein
VNQVAQINRDRVCSPTPDKLGHSILVDYVASKRKTIGGALSRCYCVRGDEVAQSR